MLTKETLDQLQKAELLQQVDYQLKYSLQHNLPVVAMPDGVSLGNIERYLPKLQRFAGTYKTTSIDNFAAFVKDHDRGATRVFVDDNSMYAVAILDYVNEFGDALHCEAKAMIDAKKKSEYTALLEFVSEKHTQKSFAEFMEDYADHIRCFNESGDPIALVKAIAAVRRIEVKATASATSEVQSYTTERSALESMSVNDSNKLPTLIQFTCVPYAEFKEFVFDIRPSVITGDPVKLTARLVRKEEVREEIAEHFCQLIENRFDDKELNVPISIGTFSK